MSHATVLKNAKRIGDLREALAEIERLRAENAELRTAAPTETMLVMGARSIGNSIRQDNHIERARACWTAMTMARDLNVAESIPVGALEQNAQKPERKFTGPGYIEQTGYIDKQKLGDVPWTGEREQQLCEDCPPAGYPTNKTRCSPCPRREQSAQQEGK